MKYEVKAKEFLAAVKAVLALHSFGESSDDRQPCLLTATDAGLVLESARLGAFITKKVAGKLLRPGSVGLNAQDLAGMKLKSKITIEAQNTAVKFTDGKTTYTWSLDAHAEEDVAEQRADLAEIQPVAKLPTLALRNGAAYATYRSENSDYAVQVTIDPGSFEYCGRDYLAYGRYAVEDPRIKAKEPCRFILGETLLSKVTKELSEGEVTVGLAKDGSVVRLVSPEIDLYHPTIDKEYKSTNDIVSHVTTGSNSQCACRFVVKCKEVVDAISRVSPVKSKVADTTMTIVVAQGKVALRQSAQTNAAICRLKVEELEAVKDLSIVVRAQYLTEFVRAAPSTAKLAVTSWNQQYLRVEVLEDNTTIDYMAYMVDAEE